MARALVRVGATSCRTSEPDYRMNHIHGLPASATVDRTFAKLKAVESPPGSLADLTPFGALPGHLIMTAPVPVRSCLGRSSSLKGISVPDTHLYAEPPIRPHGVGLQAPLAGAWDSCVCSLTQVLLVLMKPDGLAWPSVPTTRNWDPLPSVRVASIDPEGAPYVADDPSLARPEAETPRGVGLSAVMAGLPWARSAAPRAITDTELDGLNAA